jgi:hypothetical protein
MKKDYASLVKFLRSDYPGVYDGFLMAVEDSHLTLQQVKKRFEEHVRSLK